MKFKKKILRRCLLKIIRHAYDSTQYARMVCEICQLVPGPSDGMPPRILNFSQYSSNNYSTTSVTSFLKHTVAQQRNHKNPSRKKPSFVLLFIKRPVVHAKFPCLILP
jgi:hypothetical protein